MGYFDGCRPVDRFTSPFSVGIHGTEGRLWTVRDWDQRRTISVELPWKEQEEEEEERYFVFTALSRHIDKIPSDAVVVEIGKDGELISSTSAINRDRTEVVFYHLIQEFGSGAHFYRQSDLIELERLGLQVDLVTKQTDLGNDSRRLAFKYNLARNNIPLIWHDINCQMRIPKHPNIVPFDRLLVETVAG